MTGGIQWNLPPGKVVAAQLREHSERLWRKTYVSDALSLTAADAIDALLEEVAERNAQLEYLRERAVDGDMSAIRDSLGAW